jgi:hypothetical protein
MKFPIFTAMSIILVGLFMFMYIMFSYAFFNPVSGAFTLIDEQRGLMMNTNYSLWAQDLLDFQHSWWGTCFCILIVLVVVCGFIDVLRDRQ